MKNDSPKTFVSTQARSLNASAAVVARRLLSKIGATRGAAMLALVVSMAAVAYTTSSAWSGGASPRAGLMSSPALKPAKAAVVPVRKAIPVQDAASRPATDPLLGLSELNIARRGHTATQLSDGRILIIGGENDGGLVKRTESFDPVSRNFVITAKLKDSRRDHTATRLGDGRVLVAGGRNVDLINSTEIFDPAKGRFSSGASLNHARAGHSATMLKDGKVLLVGGDDQGSAEIYDPQSGTFTLLEGHLNAARSFHSAVLLRDGKVLIAGGLTPDKIVTQYGEIFDPETWTFTTTKNSMHGKRLRPTLRVLEDGKVQVIGGDDERSMEMFNGAGMYFTAYAHLLPSGDSVSAVLRAQTRAGLIHEMPAGDLKIKVVSDSLLEELLDRGEYTLTDTPEAGTAMVAGGASSKGKVLKSVMTVMSSGATVTTDKTDYHPGETVVITGTGWQSGETVELRIHRDGTDPSTDVLLSAEADSNGDIQNSEFVILNTDLGLSFLLTARGILSGYTAQTTFTDAVNLQSRESTCTTETNTFASGATVCMRASGIGGSGTQSGEFKWWAPGLDPNTAPATRTHSFSTTNGNESDSFTVTVCGEWTVRVFVPAGTLQATDTFVVTNCNTPPTCNAGGPYTSTCRTASINGATASDPNNDGLTYSWTSSNPNVTVSPSSGSIAAGSGARAVPTSTATLASNVNPCGVSATLTLTVNDGNGGTSTCTATVSFSDTQAPTANQGSIDACYQTVTAADQAALDATTGLSDTCDTSPTKAVQTSATAACITSVVIRVSDTCGNFTDYTYNTRVDNTAPTATQGTIDACYQTVTAANNAALAATTSLSDNCDSSPTKSVQTSATAACNTSVVIRVQDSCGNFTDYTYNTRVDGTAPTATQGTIAACYQTVTAANNAALAATTNLSDNCDPSPTKSVQTSATAVCATSIVIRVQDSCGNFTDYTYNTRVDNTPPTIDFCPGNLTVPGNIIGSCDANVNHGTATAIDNCVMPLVTGTRSDSLPLDDPYPQGVTTITWTATDGCNMSSCIQTITVTNPSPSVSITGPPSGALYPVGSTVNFTGTFTDTGGTHTAVWTFDAITKNGTVNESTGAVTASNTFTATGVYSVTLTVSDGCGGSGTATTVDGSPALVVIFDPAGGFVTGGGWLTSAPGSFAGDPYLTGRANFGFVSKYLRGQNVPTGETEFQFQLAGFNFHSTAYEWLVVSGSKAQYRGSGTINGMGNYGFLLTAYDGQGNGGGGVDKFRIKIWDSNNGNGVVYDNRRGQSDDMDLADPQAIGGGSIVIHR